MYEEEFYKLIGRNVKKYRHIRNITQEKLAELIYVSTSLISSLESSKINQGISINTLYKISIVLDIPISKFMESDNDEQ